MAQGTPYRLTFRPIVLKELCLECGIQQAQLARTVGVKRPTINLTLNRGYIPPTVTGFKKGIEDFIRNNQRAMQWLLKHGLRVDDIWEPLGKDMRNRIPHGVKAYRRGRALIPGDPTQIILSWEVEMITQEAMRHFKIFRHPFIDDIQKDSDIYMSEEHRYIEAAMLDAARHGGFLAVIGEVGSGKSVMRRKVIERLRKDGDVLVIFPEIQDVDRITSSAICDAIIMDISDQVPKIKLEQKARQVKRLLLERARQGYRSALIIEEAHLLMPTTLKRLKRFYELEDGYRKLLGIILIGQTELRSMLTESLHPDMREVIRRVQIAEIRGLNGHIKDYLAMKFKRVGAKIEDIMTDEAIEALKQRLTARDRDGNIISHAYPLLINNYTARAMNLAYEMGEEKVTEAVIMAI